VKPPAFVAPTTGRLFLFESVKKRCRARAPADGRALASMAVGPSGDSVPLGPNSEPWLWRQIQRVGIRLHQDVKCRCQSAPRARARRSPGR